MAFLNSSCSFTRFTVLDPVPSEFWDSIVDKLKQFAFQDIDNVPEERSYGWVTFDDMLDTTWESESVYKGDVLAFSLRIDTRRIPAGVVKKHLMIAFKEEMSKLEELNKKFIARDRKKEIKEQVILKLQQRFLPIPAVFEVIWLSEKNEVWFGSTQGKMIDLFVDYFHRSFELNLEQITPVVLASKFLSESEMSKLDTLEETHFAEVEDVQP